MIRVDRHEAFVDERGFIRDLLTNVALDSVTLLHTRDGTVRGNHWHDETIQWTYVVKGSLLVRTRERGKISVTADVAKTGDLFMSPAGEEHAWKALEDTDVLVFTTGPRSGDNYESDTHRLSNEERLI